MCLWPQSTVSIWGSRLRNREASTRWRRLGLAFAQRIFSRVVFSGIACLRIQGVHVHAFLHDVWIVALTTEHLS